MRNMHRIDETSAISFGPYSSNNSNRNRNTIEAFMDAKASANSMSGGKQQQLQQQQTFTDPFSAANSAYIPAYLYNNI